MSDSKKVMNTSAVLFQVSYQQRLMTARGEAYHSQSLDFLTGNGPHLTFLNGIVTAACLGRVVGLHVSDFFGKHFQDRLAFGLRKERVAVTVAEAYQDLVHVSQPEGGINTEKVSSGVGKVSAQVV